TIVAAAVGLAVVATRGVLRLRRPS
ncbi:MAG: hypothetical protein K0S05_2166, partial [Agromyces sp.]|nr:hypothetical protein [Agromyces sp.]